MDLSNAIRRRLEHLERVAYWSGQVWRADLTEVYDVSGVQASTDFQRYIALNPLALQYDLRRKRYLWTDQAKPIFYQPSWDDAIATLLPAESAATIRLEHPARPVRPEIQRALIAATLNGQALIISHGSDRQIDSIAPHAFGHDGFGWFARAWNFGASAYKDYPLARIAKIVGESAIYDDIPKDVDWHSVAVVEAVVNPALPQATIDLISDRFNIDAGRIRWTTRTAMAQYARHHLESLSSPVGRRHIPWFVDLEIV